MGEQNERKIGISDKMEDFAEYRPISTMAIFAFLAGFVSMGALASVVLWILPVITIIFCSLTVARINRAAVRPIGKSWAVIGLSLSCLVAVWAPTRHFSQRQTLAEMGRAKAQEWLDLILKEKNINRAHDLTNAYGERMLRKKGSAGNSGKRFKKEAKDANAQIPEGGIGFSVETVFGRPPLESLVRYRDSGSCEYVGTESVVYLKAFNAWAISQTWRFTYTAKGQQHSFDFGIVLQREVFNELRKARWHIKDVTDAKGRSALN